ncbi:hypothetical protein F4814DRAFT_458389 [Daldinia grandis]|nr:hypothetical protein F4814DRAFT_458389 [Daldinia grandis]
MPVNDHERSMGGTRVYKLEPMWSAHLEYMGPSLFIERPEVSITNHIDSYTGRCLTKEKDMLWAFLGVFSIFKEPSSSVGIFHLFGLPIMYRAAGTAGQRGATLLKFFIHSMLWTSRWSRLRCVPGVPSWAWTGWSGFRGLIYPSAMDDNDEDTELYGHALERCGLQALDCKVHFRRDSLGDRLVDLEELMSYITQDSPKYAEDESRQAVFLGDLDHGIYWTGWTTEVRFSVEGDGSCTLEDEQSLDGKINEERRKRPSFTPHDKTDTELATGLWTVIVMRWDGPIQYYGPTDCLVLANEGQDCFSRIGMIETQWNRISLGEASPNMTQVVQASRTFTRKCVKII